jgi:uncharacterized protein (TIGR00266 family)
MITPEPPVISNLRLLRDSDWGGSKSFFSGDSLPLRCSGHGDLLIASYGAIRDYTLNEGEPMTLDTGQVAFDDTIHYAVRKSGGWKSTLLGGEGLVTDFTGPGRLWLQTRNSSELVSWLAVRLPSSATPRPRSPHAADRSE